MFRSKPIEPHLQLGFISMCIFFFTLHLFFLFDVTLLGHDVDDLDVVLLVLHPPPLPNPTTVTSSCGGGGARPPPRPLYQHLSENRKAVCGRRVDSAQLCKNSRSPEFGQEVLLSPAKPTQNISFPKNMACSTYMDNRIRKSTGPPCEIRTNECLWIILCSGIDVRVLQGPKGPSAPSSAGFRALGSNSSALLAICLLHNHKKLGVRVFKLKTKDCYFLDLF